MPWKTKNEQEQRYDLVREMGAGRESIAGLSRRWRVSRKTAYKWLRRYRQNGLRGLENKNRQPGRVTLRTPRYLLERLRRLRKKRPTWGARKLHHRLKQEYGVEEVPAVSTVSRWLKRWGLARGRRRRLAGPVVLRGAVRVARHPNEVWTVDFKGWYRTGDGTRVDPLTVRDLYSRYGLRVALLHSQEVGATQREFKRLFVQYGVPERIRCDNGVPFGGGGPTGLTRLSAWWVKLGIEVDFITRGRPCENGAHEQFHRVYKAEVAKVPAQRRAEQQRRSNQWLRQYNEERPHEALRMEVPAARYRRSRRRMPTVVRPWDYPAGWIRRWVKGNGEISWQGKRRFVGEAFVRDYVGLKAVRKGVWRVYFGPKLVGELHENELGNIRTARYQTRRKGPSAWPHSGSLRSPP
jgi:transposase InsO family protein